MSMFPGLFAGLSLLLLSGFPDGSAGSRAIVGTALASGSFEVAHTEATGTATVMNGDEVQTSVVTSRVLFKAGGEIALAPHSRSGFFQDHATLFDGTLRFQASAPFFVSSRNFVVRAASPNTTATLQTTGSSLAVHVLSGGVSVLSSSGQTLARMETGKTFAFDSLAAEVPSVNGTNTSNTSVRLLGVLSQENGHYLLRDRYTGAVSEISGDVSPRLVNKLVLVDGTWIGNARSQVSQVDWYVRATRVAPSDATTAIPCTPDGAGGVLKVITLDGVVSKIRNHFLLKDPKKGSYEVVGDIDDREVGTDVHGRGFILPRKATILPAEQVVYMEARRLVIGASPCVGAIVAGTMISTGVALMRTTPSEAEVRQAPISF